MTGKKRALTVGSIAAICAAAGLLAGHAWAGGIPATGVLSYSGVIEDADGNPVTDDHQVQVNLWATPTGGVTPLCQAGPQTASARFSIPLDDGCVAVVKDNPDLYAELLVDGVVLGRTKLGAVPYAVEAAHAVSAGTADLLGTLTPASVQQRVSGTCLAGSSVRAVAADGAVTCEPDDDTTYNAGSGVTLAGSTFSADTTVVQRRVAGSCAAGSSIRVVAADGTVTCETDDNTTYSGSSGVTLTGTNFTADTSFVQRRVSGTCPAGSYITAIQSNGGVTCEIDTLYHGSPPCRDLDCPNAASGGSASCACNSNEALQGITYADEASDGSDTDRTVSIRCCK